MYPYCPYPRFRVSEFRIPVVRRGGRHFRPFAPFSMQNGRVFSQFLGVPPQRTSSCAVSGVYGTAFHPTQPTCSESSPNISNEPPLLLNNKSNTTCAFPLSHLSLNSPILPGRLCVPERARIAYCPRGTCPCEGCARFASGAGAIVCLASFQNCPACLGLSP